MKLIDTHAHVYYLEESIIESEISEAVKVGVKKVLIPNVDVASYDKMIDCCKRNAASCMPMLGLHPCSVDQHVEQNLNALASKLNDYEWIGIGEVGIDCYYNQTFLELQKIAFKKQIEWAVKRNKPLIVHSRNAFWECIACIDEMADAGFKSFGIFHCFNESKNEAEACIQRGFMIGIGGTITYKKNTALRSLIKEIGIDHVVLETDTPFLSPEPVRGKPNTPKYVVYVAQKISEILNISLEEVAIKTTQNAQKVFGFDV
jgi:TatD DNase family protein